MRSALNAAIREGLLRDNPARHIEVPSPRRPQALVWTAQRVEAWKQSDRADFYKQFVCGQVLVTLREAFAVSPGLAAGRVVVLRHDGRDPYGHPIVPCVAAVTVTRRALEGVRWHDADAIDILNAAAHEKLMVQKGRSKDLTPLDLTNEPDIAALIEAVDLEELTADS